MFAFENWHSALEMKRYLQRYIHHIGGLPDFTALRFTRYNQYESMILPMVKYLEGFGVQFHYDTKVTNIAFDCAGGKKQATRIDILHNGQEESIDLTENDLVFITNGGCVENSTIGSQNTPAEFKPELKEGGGWDLWRKIAAQDPSFGHPDKFCYDPELSNWMSATITTLDQRIVPLYQEDLQARPVQRQGRHRRHRHSHRFQLAAQLDAEPPAAVPRPAQGSALRLGLRPVHRQAGRLYQEADARLHRQGDLHGVAVPHRCAEDQIEDMATNSANTVPCMMPYIDAFFMPRAAGDRPDIVPEGAVNFAFLGQFAETARDTIFTTEYSIRTGMEAVYTLLNVDRGVPEVWGSVYDIRCLLDATVKLRDGRKITDMEMPLVGKLAMKEALKKIEGTEVEKLLKEYNVI